MNTIQNMKEKLCPSINAKCVGEECIACKKVYTPLADREVLSHYKCLNPKCATDVTPGDSTFHSPYCILCGAGRVYDKYKIEAVYKTVKVGQKEELFICNKYESVDYGIFDDYPYVHNL